MKHYLSVLILIVISTSASARQNNFPVVEASAISGSLKIDGLLNETEWNEKKGVME